MIEWTDIDGNWTGAATRWTFHVRCDAWDWQTVFYFVPTGCPPVLAEMRAECGEIFDSLDEAKSWCEEWVRLVDGRE